LVLLNKKSCQVLWQVLYIPIAGYQANSTLSVSNISLKHPINLLFIPQWFYPGTLQPELLLSAQQTSRFPLFNNCCELHN
jgi:hypothetical protein